jgi:hypothetical protein
MAATRHSGVARSLSAVSLVLLLCPIGLTQEIGSADLTLPTHQDFPYGCKELRNTGPTGDGLATPSDGIPLKMSVEIIRINDAQPTSGAAVTGTARLRNNDTRPTTIPWSTEFTTIEIGQHLESLSWEEGTFEFILKDEQGRRIPIKSMTGSFYGSRSSPGSEHTLAPGESISAGVKFKLDPRFGNVWGQVTAGEWQLMATWTQSGVSQRIAKDCGAAYFYEHYDGFYQQETPSSAIHIFEATGDTSPR